MIADAMQHVQKGKPQYHAVIYALAFIITLIEFPGQGLTNLHSCKRKKPEFAWH